MTLVLKGVSLWFTFPYVVLLAAAMVFAKMVIPMANNVAFAEIPNACRAATACVRQGFAVRF